jgi:6-phosphogluconolactonase
VYSYSFIDESINREVFFADERCVTLDDKDSNYRVWHDSFFTRYAASLTPSHIHAIDTKLVAQPAAAAEAYANNITRVFATIAHEAKSSTPVATIPPDGHTCSLFPGHALLDVRAPVCCYRQRSPIGVNLHHMMIGN